MEVLKRWEVPRAQHWLTEEQKRMLQNVNPKHILLLNEKKELELVSYQQIREAASGNRDLRAFTFLRNRDAYVVYWHMSADKKLDLPVRPNDIVLMESLGRQISVTSGQNGDHSNLPVGNRRYLQSTRLTQNELLTAFKNAKIID